ncbi:C-3 sterol dehydrogenase/C-4 decarboxylase [Magnaporthiopsis poae ATCC 64411]|uniref:C-3 sterol dehydrogenase/C-4 decarboxylase n=1 Tax=Magnaporthiopsis poae (strain ATCC 64411 / 73-15) TaxID=644358 RepID=A0A0C4DYL9_MAGP6|nr:C-3 sterol dehydrogenase/C-4 decarboxylase [Magnaporthiopsis poae ATCC 64411]
MYRDPPHVNGDETLPTWADADDDGQGQPEEAYARSKAAAHKLVLAANEPDAADASTDARLPLKTASLVLAHMYGERDSQMLRTMLDTTALPGAPFVRIGDGTNLIEVVDVANAAAALRLAAKALLDPARAAGRVDGEAFNVSDDHPVLFWHHVRVMYDAAQRHYGTPGEPRVFVLPGWFMWTIVWIVDWVLRIFTLGRVRPPVSLSKLALLYALYTHTYSTRKIRERLGFKPVSDHDAVIAAAVERELKRRDAEKDAVKKVA